jgi:alpha-tubulin suppressor-like RCC1 family protein
MQARAELAPWFVAALAASGCGPGVMLPPIDPGVVEVSAGIATTCARSADGAVRCWGTNAYGEIGNGTTMPFSMPAPVTLVPAAQGALQVVTNGFFTAALLPDGTALWWGLLPLRASDGSVMMSASPVPVPGLVNAVELVAATAQLCALTRDGTVQCLPGSFHAIEAQDFGGPVQGFDSEGGFACALMLDGRVRCSGLNAHGELGDGTLVDHVTGSVAVQGLTNAVQIATGDEAACALRADGTVACWGSAALVGDGGGIDRATPTVVPGLAGVVRIEMSYGNACAVLADGSARCWDANQAGQVGDGTLTNRATPVPLVGLTNIVSIALDVRHGCAGLTDGSVWCWGSNEERDLGSDTPDAPQPTPIRVTF